MSQPLISIITVVYNGMATLQTTLESVARQTWPRIEYILVDGGSTDGTLEIIDKYSAHIAASVSERDNGVYDAMNKGIRMAEGDYIYFLGSDDRLENDQVLAAVFSDPSSLEYDFIYGNVKSPSYKGWYDGPFSYEKLLVRNISHQAIFYKRDIFQRIGDYNLCYPMHADWDLNIRCFKDPLVKAKYVDVLVARFGAEGISSGHDIPFLQEVLIKEKLKWQDRCGGSLRALKAYDEWWRLLRNAGIRDLATLEKCAGGEKIPSAVKRMVAWQKRLPAGLLRRGTFSKSMMIISYISKL